MKVKLIRATENPLELIAETAPICYGKEESNNPSRLIEHLFKLEHMSVFEHIYFTFEIEDISRACLGQLVRHRHTSPTVRSQRYSNEANQGYVTPDSIRLNSRAFEIFVKSIEDSFNSYQLLLDLGIYKEDARYVLPEATHTKLRLSMNLRELLHIVRLRNTKEAQWEIRHLAQKLVSCVNEELHFMFE